MRAFGSYKVTSETTWEWLSTERAKLHSILYCGPKNMWPISYKKKKKKPISNYSFKTDIKFDTIGNKPARGRQHTWRSGKCFHSWGTVRQQKWQKHIRAASITRVMKIKRAIQGIGATQPTKDTRRKNKRKENKFLQRLELYLFQLTTRELQTRLLAEALLAAGHKQSKAEIKKY